MPDWKFNCKRKFRTDELALAEIGLFRGKRMSSTQATLLFASRRMAAVLAAVAAVFCTASAATPEESERVTMLMKAFDQAALLRDDGTSGIVRRWAEPIRPRMLNTFGHDWDEHALRYLREQAVPVGLSVEPAPAGAEGNMVFEFVELPFLMAGGSRVGCLAHSSWATASGKFLRATLTINRNWRDLEDLKRCIRHEILHALGLLGHPHFADSILSYSSGRRDLTEVDRTLLNVLYDPRLKGGFYRLPALLAARAVILEAVLGERAKAVDPKTFGESYLESVLRSMTAEAEAGGTAAQVQLGNAYAHGHVVPVAMENAVRFWRMAAERGDPKAQYELGRAIREGRAGARDPVQALTWLLIAGEQGHERAVREAEALAAGMAAEQAAEAKARAKAFTPAR